MFKYITAITVLVFISHSASALRITHEPYTKGAILAAQFSPITSFLEREGYKNSVYVKTQNFKGFYETLHMGGLDVVFATVLHARILIEEYGYIPILVKDTELKAVVIVKEGRGYRSIRELEGKTILSPFPYDPAAYLGRSCLNDVNANIVDVNGISNVLLGVLRGQSEAGFIADVDVLFMVESMHNKFNVLATSEESAATYILVSPELKVKSKNIMDTFLKLNDSPIMKDISEKHGFNKFLPISDQTLKNLENNADAVDRIYSSLGIWEINGSIKADHKTGKK